MKNTRSFQNTEQDNQDIGNEILFLYDIGYRVEIFIDFWAGLQALSFG